MNLESKSNKLNLWIIFLLCLIFINLVFINFKFESLKTSINRKVNDEKIINEGQKKKSNFIVLAEKEAVEKMPAVFEYSYNKIYNVFVKSGNMITIKLQKDEKLESGFAGDSENWIISSTNTSTGDIVLIKPLKVNLSTNVTFVTNKRMYLLNIESTSDKYNPVVEWTYPKEKDGNLVKSEKGKELWK